MRNDVKLRKYISEWDPMGLIEQGYPKDEYDREALKLRMEYDQHPQMTEAQLAEIVHKIFTTELGLEPKSFLQECETRATDIRQLLLEGN